MQKYFAHDNNAKIELDERVGETKSWMLKEKYTHQKCVLSNNSIKIQKKRKFSDWICSTIYLALKLFEQSNSTSTSDKQNIYENFLNGA